MGELRVRITGYGHRVVVVDWAGQVVEAVVEQALHSVEVLWPARSSVGPGAGYNGTLVLAVEELEFIDDSGIRLVRGVERWAASAGVRLMLAGATGPVLLRLNTCGLTEIVTCYPTRDQALQVALAAAEPDAAPDTELGEAGGRDRSADVQSATATNSHSHD